jgi:hypothetical protein
MKINKLIFIIIIIYLSVQNLKSQNSIVDILSIKSPTKESSVKQSNILKKWGVSDNNLYNISSLFVDSLGQSLNYTLDTHMVKWSTYSPIQFRVYKNNGVFYTGWAYCFGSLKTLNILQPDTILNLSRLPLNRKLTLNNDLNFIESYTELKSKIQDYDYIILAFWASYYGRSAKKMLQTLDNYTKDKKILLIKINYNGYE